MSKQRRKAIDGKLIEESKTSPGYFKYQFTILELDGSKTIMPAYGKDMEDALERLAWVKRTETKPYNMIIVFLLLTVTIVPSTIAAITNNPLWVIFSLVLSIIYGFTMVNLNNYFNKK